MESFCTPTPKLDWTAVKKWSDLAVLCLGMLLLYPRLEIVQLHRTQASGTCYKEASTWLHEIEAEEEKRKSVLAKCEKLETSKELISKDLNS